MKDKSAFVFVGIIIALLFIMKAADDVWGRSGSGNIMIIVIGLMLIVLIPLMILIVIDEKDSKKKDNK